MPISVQLTEGLLDENGQRTVLPRIAAALLRSHGLESNAFMRSSVVGHVQIHSEGLSYAGAGPGSVAVIEVKVPSVAFTEQAVRDAFVSEVTDIVGELAVVDHPRSRTFVNVSYAVDGSWGIGGKAFTNAGLGEAIAAGIAAGER